MAITDLQQAQQLQAGAPSIKYEGNEGPQAPQQTADLLLKEQYDKYVYDLLEQRPEATPMSFEEFRMMVIGEGRSGMSYGGRPGYGLGDLVSSVTKPVKKVLKKVTSNPLLAAGVGALASNYLGPYKGWLAGTPASWTGVTGRGPLDMIRGGTNYISGTSGLLGRGGGLGLIRGAGSWMPTALGGITAASALPFAGVGMEDPTIEGGQINVPDQIKFDYDYDSMIEEVKDAVASNDVEKIKAVNDKYGLDLVVDADVYTEDRAQGGRIGYLAGGPLKKGIGEIIKKFKRPIFSFDDESKMIMDLTGTGKYTEKELMTLEGDQLVEIYVREGFTPPKAIPNVEETIDLKNITPKIEKAEGGRIGAQEGGLMNLGGMEKDYGNEGGFVPIGKKEKADDVPARLSVNEFVMTADAVRGAGGGDIDKGAEIMENMMKHLEAGGQVSEESQGLGGAQEMFEVSERLSEVV